MILRWGAVTKHRPVRRVSSRLASRFQPAVFAALLLACFFLPSLSAVDPQRKIYDVPAGDAPATLKKFADQSGEQIVYMVDNVRGQRTRPISGEYTARGALDAMVAGTDLVVTQDQSTGAFVVGRKRSDRAETAAPVAVNPVGPRAPAAAAPSEQSDAIVQMSMFEVTTTQGHGYVATNAATALKTNESLMDIPQTVLVMSRDLLDDIGYGLTAENLQFFGSSNSKIGESSSTRGAGVSYAYVDDMPENQPFEDNAPIDSYQIIKGPAQVLYLNSTMFGVVLKATKKPLPFNQAVVTAQVNDWGQYRFTGDISTPIGEIGAAKLGNRIVIAQQGGGNWQINAKDNHTVIFDSFQVILKNTTVRVDYDYQNLLTIPAGLDFVTPNGRLYTGAGRVGFLRLHGQALHRRGPGLDQLLSQFDGSEREQAFQRPPPAKDIR